MEHDDLLWLSGLLEGEGSFVKGPPSRPNCPQISLQMTDADVVARAAALCGVKYYRHAHRNARWKDCFMFHVRGGRAVALMKSLRPFMGIRRQDQIDRAVASYDIERVRHRYREWDDQALLTARKTMSLREIGKKFGWNHETIRKRLKAITAA